MRKLLVLAVVGVVGLMSGTVSLAGADCTNAQIVAIDSESPELSEGQARVVIPVNGMTCGACASAITRAVKKLDGVITVDVDYEKGSTTVVLEEEKVTTEQIVEAINKTGFKASMPAKG